MTKEGDQLKIEHTNRGSKLMNLNEAFEMCISIMFVALHKFYNSNAMIVWCMLYLNMYDD